MDPKAPRCLDGDASGLRRPLADEEPGAPRLGLALRSAVHALVAGPAQPEPVAGAVTVHIVHSPGAAVVPFPGDGRDTASLAAAVGSRSHEFSRLSGDACPAHRTSFSVDRKAVGGGQPAG